MSDVKTQRKALIVVNNEDDEEKEHIKNKNKQTMETWFNTVVFLKSVDVIKEQFSVQTYFNFFWKVNDIDSMKEIESKMVKYEKLNIQNKCLWIDLLSLTDVNIQKLIVTKTPIPWLYDLDWMFPNTVRPPDLDRCGLFKKTSNIWYVELSFEADFEETFELYSFPVDIQFLNMKFRSSKNFKYLSTKPVWLDELELEKGWFQDVPINCAILEPAKKEWILLEPWIDFRINLNIFCNLIRLRVERKPTHYILYNVMPLALIIGLSFLSIVIDETVDKLAFIVTLLLTIAAGRSELVPEMPRASAPTLIDDFVNVGYCVFAAMMVGFGINDSLNVGGSTEWIIWTVCMVVYVVTLCRFVLAWCKKQNVDIWKQRSKQEFEEWSWEVDYDKFTKVDPEHMLGTDFDNIVQKGDFESC